MEYWLNNGHRFPLFRIDSLKYFNWIKISVNNSELRNIRKKTLLQLSLPKCFWFISKWWYAGVYKMKTSKDFFWLLFHFYLSTSTCQHLTISHLRLGPVTIFNHSILSLRHWLKKLRYPPPQDAMSETKLYYLEKIYFCKI